MPLRSRDELPKVLACKILVLGSVRNALNTNWGWMLHIANYDILRLKVMGVSARDTSAALDFVTKQLQIMQTIAQNLQSG